MAANMWSDKRRLGCRLGSVKLQRCKICELTFVDSGSIERHLIACRIDRTGQWWHFRDTGNSYWDVEIYNYDIASLKEYQMDHPYMIISKPGSVESFSNFAKLYHTLDFRLSNSIPLLPAQVI